MMRQGESDQQVSVIVVTRNRPTMLRDCLEHLSRQLYDRPFETIVVDSSSDEQTQIVLHDFPSVKSLRIRWAGRTNTGQARNLGIQHANGEFVAFLDDDCMAHGDWLSRLMAAYTTPDIGAVGGRWIDEYESTRVNPQDSRIGVLQANGYSTTNFVLDPGAIVEVDHLRGGNVVFRRKTLYRLGFFDLYYDRCLGMMEETDLCTRIKQGGWRLLYQPEAVVNHRGGVRSDYNRDAPYDPRRVLGSTRGYAYFFFKNFGYNYHTLKHVLGGRQILALRTFMASPRWPTFRTVFLYTLGAWWGLSDSLIGSLRRVFKGERRPS